MTIVLRPDGLEWLCEQNNIPTDKALAKLIGINQSNLSRVKQRKADPGVPFIAGTLNTFGGWRSFDTLFEIVPDPQGTAA